MLGRYQTPGCCPGTRQGRRRIRKIRQWGDCTGAESSTRWRKRVEQRQVAREIHAWLHEM